MPPPPLVTPSPHRFVVKTERASQRPAAAVRNQPQYQTSDNDFELELDDDEEHEQTPRQSTTQFKVAPRFTFSATPRPTLSQILPPSSAPPLRYLTPASKTAARVVDVIETSFEDEVHNLLESIESGRIDTDGAELEDKESIQQRSPKRRRLSTSPIIDEGDEVLAEREELEVGNNFSSSLSILSSQPAPRRHFSVAPHFRNIIPAPPFTPNSGTTTTDSNNLLRPHRFRPPDPETTGTQTDPLPEQFSPHRKGQKYIPGGMAAEMRDWLVNIETTIPIRRHGEKPTGWPQQVEMVINEISGNARAGMTLIVGRQINILDKNSGMNDTLATVRMALAGEGTVTGLQKGGRIEVGKRVYIKGPMWEFVIEEERWGVGVDWKVLTD